MPSWPIERESVIDESSSPSTAEYSYAPTVVEPDELICGPTDERVPEGR